MWAGEMPAHSDHASHMSPLQFPATPLVHVRGSNGCPARSRMPGTTGRRRWMIRKAINPYMLSRLGFGSDRVRYPSHDVWRTSQRWNHLESNGASRAAQRHRKLRSQARPKSEQHATRDTAVVRSGIERKSEGSGRLKVTVGKRDEMFGANSRFDVRPKVAISICGKNAFEHFGSRSRFEIAPNRFVVRTRIGFDRTATTPCTIDRSATRRCPPGVIDSNLEVYFDVLFWNRFGTQADNRDDRDV
jgi:hypothetical protein